MNLIWMRDWVPLNIMKNMGTEKTSTAIPERKTSGGAQGILSFAGLKPASLSERRTERVKRGLRKREMMRGREMIRCSRRGRMMTLEWRMDYSPLKE